MALIEIFSPRAESSIAAQALSPLPADLNGKVVGLLNNDKPNAEVLLAAAEAAIAQAFNVGEIVRAWKPRTGAAPTPQQMADLSRCDLVINALGD